MIQNFWDQRYSNENYAYGVEANEFFKTEIEKLKPGNLLLPAEGEGRNAIYAAKLGWNVSAFDISSEGKMKAEKLALKHGVSINYQLCSFNNFVAEENQFDCIALIFAHANSEQRASNHRLVQQWLKPGGTVLLHGFEKEQLGNNSGGPQSIEMLFSKEELLADFDLLSKLLIETSTVELNEGEFHSGLAHVINLVGSK